MKRVQRFCLCVVAVLLLMVTHYWITLTVGFTLQAAAVYIAYLERGYFAIGSEILVLPVAALIGYKLTPVMEVRITERGIRYRVRGRKVSGYPRRIEESGHGNERRRVG